jgi:prevent-host-death family protein
MTLQVMKSREARNQWRSLLDRVLTGEDILIERNGKPVAVLIAAEDYDSVRAELEDLRAGQRAAAVYEAWKEHPEDSRSWEDVRAELVADGKLDE